jgi:hypothetical protein
VIAGFGRQIDNKPFRTGRLGCDRTGGADTPGSVIAILRPGGHERWLAGSYHDALALKRPQPADCMK